MLEGVREKGTKGWSRERGKDPGKEESERWGLEQQRKRLKRPERGRSK